MNALHWLSLPLLLALLTLSGCKHDTTDSKEKVYDIKGKVVAVDAGKKEVTLDHEAIPGAMQAMEMPFKVEDAKILDGLKAGDQVEGKLKRTPGGDVITELHKR